MHSYCSRLTPAKAVSINYTEIILSLVEQLRHRERPLHLKPINDQHHVGAILDSSHLWNQNNTPIQYFLMVSMFHLDQVYLACRTQQMEDLPNRLSCLSSMWCICQNRQVVDLLPHSRWRLCCLAGRQQLQSRSATSCLGPGMRSSNCLSAHNRHLSVIMSRQLL